MHIWALDIVDMITKPVLCAGRGCGTVGVRIRIVRIIGIQKRMMKEARNIKKAAKKRYVKMAEIKHEILRRMWRICNNPRCNDWNDEPEYIAVPYEILEEKKKSYVCIRAGWHQKNILAKREFYRTKEECQAAIVEKYFFSKKFSDEQLEELWGILVDVPVNDNDEIMERFIDFPIGTNKEDVWHWFDEKHSKGVYALMNTGESDGE